MYIQKHNFRFAFVFFSFLAFLFICSIKLIFLQVVKYSEFTQIAKEQHEHFIELESIRGRILDRHEAPLAFNVAVHSLYANPRMMTQASKEKAVKELPKILNIDPSFIKKRLLKDKYFVWLKRKIKLDVKNEVERLKIKGLAFQKESQRYYPNGSLAAHVVGFANIDNEGQEGIELFYNKMLKGTTGRMQVLRDAQQRDLMLESSMISPVNGFNLVLTIDETIQYLAEKFLGEAFKENKAKSGTIIVMDVKTGEILALANRPTYSLDNFGRSTIESRTNRAISHIYEPGSIFKIVALSAALEEDAFEENDQIFCENGEYRVGNHILHDHKPHGMLSFQEVFELSSNIGVTKVAERLGPAIIYKYAKRFRFGMNTNIDLRGEVNGWLKKPSLWSKTTIGAIPIGHEVTTTPLQMVSALSAIANDGVYMQPFMVKYIKDNAGNTIRSFNPRVVDRVISQSTARRVQKILTGVVARGTGTRAQIDGVLVAGKTGTAQKVINGRYSHSKYYASFMGFAPADNPRLAAIVVFDEPHPRYFGGTVSAPVFKEVIERSLKYLETSH